MTLPEAIGVLRDELKSSLSAARQGDECADSSLDYLLDFDYGHGIPEDAHDPDRELRLYRALTVIREAVGAIEAAKREKRQHEFGKQVRQQKRGSKR